jgi:hypothetical protein
MNDKRFFLMLSCINGALIALMAAAVTALVILPFFIVQVAGYFIYLKPTLIFFYTGGVLIFWFFWVLRSMIVTVRADTAFTVGNVKRLKTLSWSLLFLAVDFGYIMCYVPSYSKVLCMVILALGFFCARILAYLIAKAIEYKEDMDLTV